MGITVNDLPPDDAELVMYHIYHSPADYPGKFVVRKWTVAPGGGLQPTQSVALASTLMGARAVIPVGMYRLEREPKDDPCIVEIWL